MSLAQTSRRARPRSLLRPWLGPAVLLLQLGIASAAVSCNLKFEGYGNKQGLKSAHLSCTGGSITAAAHPVLAHFSRSFSGVTWSDSAGCGRGKQFCLLTICGASRATFPGAVITTVNVSSSVAALLCVRDSSSLVFDSAKFHGNTGLLLAGDPTAVHLHIKKSQFTNTTNIVKHLEGALMLNGGTGLVQSSTFAGNRGFFKGGAIALRNNARLTVVSSILQDNTAEHGGAIYARDASRFKLQDTLLTRNTAVVGGGLLLHSHAAGEVVNCSFSLNNATTGGAIHVQAYATLHLVASNFSRNAASTGGAVSTAESSRVHLKACRLTGNSALLGGGMVMTDSSSASITHSVFASNNANMSGGGLHLGGAGGLHPSLGGGAERVSVLQTQFVNNSAAIGGAVGVVSYSYAQLTSVRLQGNMASMSGGAVLVMGNGTLYCTQSQFLENIASFSGGAITAKDNATFMLRHCTFESNTGSTGASGAGGAVFLGEASRGNVYAVTAVNNTAHLGGFAAVSSSSTLNVTSGIFIGNVVVGRAGKGGLLNAEDAAVVDLRDCRVSGGAEGPGVYGGAIYISDDVRLTLSACTISEYGAERGGGLAAFGNSSVHVQHCIWRNLTADQFGGGAFLASKAYSTWHGGKFVDTHAQYGGAVNAVLGRLDVADTAFENATSSDGGGAMYIKQAAAVNLRICRFSSCSSDSDGGALHIHDNAHVMLLGCNITNCTAAGAGGAMVASGTAVVNMQRCRLQQNHAKTFGGAVALRDSVQVLAKDSGLLGNVCAQKGGGLWADATSKVHLAYCSVDFNKAAMGGGLYLFENATLGLDLTSIVDNAATSSGGGVVLGSSRFPLAALRTSVRHNQAPMSADISALPVALRMHNSSAVHGFVSRLRSDEGLWNATMLVTGHQDLPSAGVTVTARLDGSQLTQNTSGEDGLLDMHMKLRKPPGAYNISFTVPGADNVQPVLKTVYVVKCGVGDITASTGDACQTCERGYYSLDPRNSSCDQCVPNAECPGGSVILPLPGFWHSSPNSVQMHRCFNQDACPGLSNRQCAAGYTGNLCAVCDAQYGTVKAFTCKKCMKPAAFITLYTLAAVILLLAVRGLSALALAEAGRPVAAGQPRAVDLTKPVVVYAQWLFIVMNLSGVPWPASLSTPLQALAWFWSSASANSLGLDCVLPHNSKTPVAVQKVLFALLMPLAILSLLLCCEVLLSVCCRRSRFLRSQRHLSMADRSLSLFLCMSFLFLPTWTHAAFSLFTCVPLDVATDPPYDANAVGSFWAQDMSERCYTREGYHMAWALGLGIPLLLLLCVALPLGLFGWLWVSKRRGKLANDRFRSQYGFLYRTWREDVCWWEAVVVLQTIVLVMVGTFGYALGPYYQALVITAALGIILVLLLSVRPHVSAAAGVVSLRSLGVLITTAFAALTFLPYRNILPAPGYTMAMGVFVLLINLAFVLSTLWQLLRLVNWAAVRRLASRCCCCTAAPCNCCKPSQPGTLARQPGGRCAALSSLRVLTLPWHPVAAGWCGTGQLQESVGGSLHYHGPVKATSV